MCWSLYCASVSNSFSDTGSFEDFLKKTKTPVEQNRKDLNGEQIQEQLYKADKLLSGFIPAVKGGG